MSKRKTQCGTLGSLARPPDRDSAAAYGLAFVLLLTASGLVLALDQVAGAPSAAAFAIWPAAIAAAAWCGGMRVGALHAAASMTIAWRFWRASAPGADPWGLEAIDMAVLGCVSIITALAAGALRLYVDQLEGAVHERALSARESGHRVRNILAVVQGIAAKVARNAESASEFKAILQRRLQAISEAQEVLLRSQWQDVSLGDLIAQALAPFLPNPAFRLAPGPPALVEARLVRGICLALHELAVNSLKYGALRGETGQARLSWSVAGGRCDLDWREDSAAPAEIEPGYGSALIYGAFADEPDVKVRYSLGAEGVRARFSWPVRAGGPASEEWVL